MNNLALLKTKNELYQNSQLGKERLKLIEEYKNSILSVVDRLFTNTETGKKMLEMYPELIIFENYLTIPGKVDKRVTTEGSSNGYYYRCYDEVANLKIPEILDNLNNNWNPFIYHENDTDKLTDEEKGKILDLTRKLESNAESCNHLWKNIVEVFDNISEAQLKKFPEAYSIYVKHRTEINNENREAKK